MGKGKRNKMKRNFDASMNKVFAEANKQSRIPKYDESKFLKEYEGSGFSFNVFRKRTYLKARKDPQTVDNAIDVGILKTLKQMNITIESDGTMVEHNKDTQNEI